MAYADKVLDAAALLKSGQPAILLGDFNVMPTEIDVYKPERWLDDAPFTPQARAAYTRLLEQGWTGALRTCIPASGSIRAGTTSERLRPQRRLAD